jgi:acyl-CoA oxidase
MGRWANFAVVFAKLIINNKDKGVSVFMVQIRDTYKRCAMPGIQVGDIGGKLGSNGNDNGWLIFDQVRIPRSDMFSRFSEVSREG